MFSEYCLRRVPFMYYLHCCAPASSLVQWQHYGVRNPSARINFGGQGPTQLRNAYLSSALPANIPNCNTKLNL